MMTTIQKELVEFGRKLGDPEKDFVILGEGNISGKDNDTTFWVKASGSSLSSLQDEDLVEIYFEKVIALLDKDELSDKKVKEGLLAAKTNPSVKVVPSVETFLHAILLRLPGVNFVGHTHPTPVNAILCSKKSVEAYSGSLFPDQIVYCGPAPVYVPYTDPGLPLALRVKQEIEKYIAKRDITPKVVLMENHGLFALGATTEEVEHITNMSIKAARVILGTYALGGPRFLSEKNVNRIYSRPDEKYRKQVWGIK
jgi:rhamnose utilization protein RhaD (predicted bifunctional aldolase and dehydrogenase)